ncbi:g9015 [Coccomyxa viridis]|uniref:G9015 protein n=1 Tax=Coccomyxa viridis TaxID=1274662 RepID=A0ABP1G1X2_9CHLO
MDVSHSVIGTMGRIQLFVVTVLAALALAAPIQAITDADILNFALNLECLEATFYSYAAYGSGLNSTLRGGGPMATGGMQAKLSSKVQNYANEVAKDEINHVAFLRMALGSAAVPCPQIDVGPAFGAIVKAALGPANMNMTFSPYDNDLDFLLAAYTLEDVGVTAYNGAAPLISSKSNLGAAASIMATEAYHGGIVRTLLYQMGYDTVTPFGLQTVDFAQKISDLRSTVGGGKDAGITSPKANGVKNTPYSANLVPTDSNSLVYARTPTEVLNIVYGGSAAKPSAFYPKGVNGNINGTGSA